MGPIPTQHVLALSKDKVNRLDTLLSRLCNYSAVTMVLVFFLVPTTILLYEQTKSIETRRASTFKQLGTVSTSLKSDFLLEIEREFEELVKIKTDEIIERLPNCQGKEHLIKIMIRADHEQDIDEKYCEELPLWSEVVELYGDEPIVYGLESCQLFQSKMALDSNAKPDVRVAGLFNTGTNALQQSFSLNIKEMEDTTSYQNPGGKHVPPKRTWIDTFEDDMKARDNVLQVVLIRDPFRWMQSMCRMHYNAHWPKGVDDRCPNLIPTAKEREIDAFRNLETFNITVSLKGMKFFDHYESLAEMWSTWNGLYMNLTTPRIVIRFEDTLFHPWKVMDIIKECAGLPSVEPYKYHVENAKHAAKSADFGTGLKKYGRKEGRYDNISPEEKEYLKSALNPELMKTFHYTYEY